MIPENKNNYVPNSYFDLKLDKENGKKMFSNKTILIQSCKVPQDDGGAWHVQRVVREHRFFK